MYIPGWLLFIGVVVALFAFKRLRTAAGAALGWGLLIGGGLVLLALVGLVLYLISKDHFHVAGIIVMSAVNVYIGIRMRDIRDWKGRLKLGTLKRRLREHDKAVARAKGPAAVVKARREFASELTLGQTLFFFFKHIENYPTLYEQAEEDEVPWSSSVISQNEIGIDALDTLKHIGLFCAEGAEDDECVTYQFSVSGKSFVFCGVAESVPDVTLKVTPGWTLQAVRIFVVALPRTVVLETLIIYESNPTHFRYRHEIVESFRPAEWLIELMSVADRVAPEYAARLKAAEHEQAQEQAKRFA